MSKTISCDGENLESITDDEFKVSYRGTNSDIMHRPNMSKTSTGFHQARAVLNATSSTPFSKATLIPKTDIKGNTSTDFYSARMSDVGVRNKENSDSLKKEIEGTILRTQFENFAGKRRSVEDS